MELVFLKKQTRTSNLKPVFNPDNGEIGVCVGSRHITDRGLSAKSGMSGARGGPRTPLMARNFERSQIDDTGRLRNLKEAVSGLKLSRLELKGLMEGRSAGWGYHCEIRGRVIHF